jgi:hypothetical protein
MATLKASPEIIDLMKAQSAEINRLRDGMKELAESFGAGHLECRDKILALINPEIKAA